MIDDFSCVPCLWEVGGDDVASYIVDLDGCACCGHIVQDLIQLFSLSNAVKKGNFVSVLFWNIRRREHSSTLWLVFPVICWSLSELEIWNSLIEKKPFNASKERCQGANSEWNFCVILVGQNLTHFFCNGGRGEVKKQWFGGQPIAAGGRKYIFVFDQCWNFARKMALFYLTAEWRSPKRFSFLLGWREVSSDTNTHKT